MSSGVTLSLTTTTESLESWICLLGNLTSYLISPRILKEFYFSYSIVASISKFWIPSWHVVSCTHCPFSMVLPPLPHHPIPAPLQIQPQGWCRHLSLQVWRTEHSEELKIKYSASLFLAIPGTFPPLGGPHWSSLPEEPACWLDVGIVCILSGFFISSLFPAPHSLLPFPISVTFLTFLCFTMDHWASPFNPMQGSRSFPKQTHFFTLEETWHWFLYIYTLWRKPNLSSAFSSIRLNLRKSLRVKWFLLTKLDFSEGST